MTLEQRIEAAQNSLAAATTDEQKQLLSIGIEKLKKMLPQQKKNQEQPVEKTEQLPPNVILPTVAEMEEWRRKEQEESKEVDELIEWVKNSPVEPMTDEEWEAYQEWKKIPKEEKVKQHKAFVAEMDAKHLKTVKAPEFSMPDELINIELEDSKGNKQIKTFSKAQVRALARKYFSNVHESWLGKDRKMGVGFKNLLAYVVAWKEFDGALPVLRDVLPDYDRYNKGGESKEASEAFKVAQELYKKIVEILNDAK